MQLEAIEPAHGRFCRVPSNRQRPDATTTALPHSVESAAILVQDEQPEIAVLPGTLERVSWPAIFTGTILSLVFLYMFNMIGLALELTQINPEYAAGFGGLVGVPEELPEAEVDNVRFSEVSGTSQTTSDLQFGDEAGW